MTLLNSIFKNLKEPSCKLTKELISTRTRFLFLYNSTNRFRTNLSRLHFTANANVSYLPIFSKETFRSGLHEDDAKRNPNHHIPYNPSRETARLLAVKERWLPLASGGFLDLHEDPWRGEGYAFVWSDTGDLGDRMVGLIEGYFPLFEGGRIERDDQGMIGDYLASLGVTPSVTSETPVLGEDLEKRVGVNVEIIKEFLK
jgi:hypothetical protein